MKRLFSRQWLVLTLGIMLVVGATGLVSAEVLRVGSDATFPPFEFIDDNTRQPTGFDIELIKAVGEAMGVEMQIINTAWEGIIPGLILGQYDLVISAMTITDERAASVDFSDPYFTTGQVIVVRAGDTTITEPADLNGKRVGVQIGTTGHFSAEAIDGANIRAFQTAPDAFLALKARQVDAVVVDELVAMEELQANPGQTMMVGRPFTMEYYGIAVKKGREDLLRRVNRGLAQIKVDGTYDEIYEKWIGSF